MKCIAGCKAYTGKEYQNQKVREVIDSVLPDEEVIKPKEYKAKPIGKDEYVFGQLLKLAHPSGKTLEKRTYIITGNMKLFHGIWILERIRVLANSVIEIN